MMSLDLTPSLSRRGLLASGAGALALAFGGCSVTQPGTTPTQTGPVTVEGWLATRGDTYFLGHRGAAAVMPEHSLPGYLQVLDWGVPALEISTGVSSDGAVFCMHDNSLDRTTTEKGLLADTPASQIDQAKLRVPRLGPGWLGDNMPPVPRLLDVLERIDRRAILCIEAKSSRALEPMLDILTTLGLMDSIFLKAPVGSYMTERARQENVPVFAYLGSPEDVTRANLAIAKKTLTDPRDVLVVPTRMKGKLMPADLLAQVKAAAKTVWVYSTHRRCEVDYYRKAGVEGFVASNAGYASGAVKPTADSTWENGRLSTGLMTRDPYSESQALTWQPPAIQFGVDSLPTYITLGDVSPIASVAQSTIEIAYQHVDAVGVGLEVFVCTADDENPAVVAPTSGYRILADAEGVVGLAAAGEPDKWLGRTNAAVPAAGVPRTLRVRFDGGRVDVDLDGAQLSVADDRWRGGYLHLGRPGRSGKVQLTSYHVS